MFQELSTNKLILRKVTYNDIESILKYINNPEINKYIAVKGNISYEDEVIFIANIIKNYTNSVTRFLWVIEFSKHLAGVISTNMCKNNNQRLTLGPWLGQEFWGQGIITEAVNKVVEFVFTKLDITSLEIGAFEPNVGSRKVAEKCNFKLDGIITEGYKKEEQIFDTYIYTLTKNRWKGLTSNRN